MAKSKIIIHSTQTSLNERFSTFRNKAASRHPPIVSTNLHAGSSANKRFASELEQRLMERLSIKKKMNGRKVDTKRATVPVKKRLPIKSRLSLPSHSNDRGDTRNRKSQLEPRLGPNRSILRLKDGLITKSFQSRLAGKQMVRNAIRTQNSGLRGNRGRRQRNFR